MRKIALALILAIPIFSGCRYFVPPSIKKESAIIRIDVETCQKEILDMQAKSISLREEAIKVEAQGDSVTAADLRAKASDLDRQIAEKALRSYKRVTPNIVNMDYYMQGRDSKGNK
jgi:hypothetical protein